MYPQATKAPSCIVYTHDNLDDSKELITYWNISEIDSMLRAVAAADAPAPQRRRSPDAEQPQGHAPPASSDSNHTNAPVVPTQPTAESVMGTESPSIPSWTPMAAGTDDAPCGFFHQYVRSLQRSAHLSAHSPPSADTDRLTLPSHYDHVSADDRSTNRDSVLDFAFSTASGTTRQPSTEGNSTMPSRLSANTAATVTSSAMQEATDVGHVGEEKSSAPREAEEAQTRLPDPPAPSEPDEVRAGDHVSSACRPLSLAIGAAASVMASFADYATGFTWCHCIDDVGAEAVPSVWYTTALLTAEFVLAPQNVHCPRAVWPQKHRRSHVVGAFVVRVSATAFTVGVVTACSESDPSLDTALAEFTRMTNRTFSRCFVELPIGQSLRRCSMRLWWRPSEERVRPFAVLPPLKATLTDERWRFLSAGHMQTHGWPVPAAVMAEADPGTEVSPNEDVVVFKGYKAIYASLFRPFSSCLGGTCQRPIPHRVGERCITPVAAARRRPRRNAVASNRAVFLHSISLATGDSDSQLTKSWRVDSARVVNMYRNNPYALQLVADIESGSAGGVDDSSVGAAAPASSLTVADSSLSGFTAASHMDGTTAIATAAPTEESGREGDPSAAAVQRGDGNGDDDRGARDGVVRFEPSRTREGVRLARVHIVFGDLRVSRSGEHLLAFETTVLPPFRPFLCGLSVLSTPFLVVDLGDE